MKKKTTLLKKIIFSLISILIIIFIAFYIYTLNYYRADDTALSILNNDNITQEKNITTITPVGENRNIGVIFYPGGKVEDISYLPLLNDLSLNGITTFLVDMPFNLAVFNVNEANEIIEKYPNIDSWYLMGHSLGGAMASSYSEKNGSKLKGLILLASYPLNNSVENTITIYGSNDLVLDQSKVNDMANVYIIEGGNHAYFGNYGEQKGDGSALITREEQQDITLSIILNHIF
ncbi:MAG: alpha/beta fold hydrolase [Pleomorphochaeta sp.]